MACKSARRRARADAKAFNFFLRECEESHFQAYSATGRGAWEAERRYGEEDYWTRRLRAASEELRKMDVPAAATATWKTGAPLPWL